MPETPLNIPSSPPVFENMYPQTSSPGLPPLPDYDSGFMSGGPDGAMSDDCNGGIRQAHGVDFRPQNPQPPQQQQQQQPQDQMYKSSKPNETKNAQQGKFVPILPALPPSAVPTSDAAEPLNFSAFAPNPSTTAPVAVTNTISAPAPPQQLQLHPQSQQPRQLHENLIHQYPMQQPSQPSQHPPLPLPQLGEISRPSSRASYRHRPLAPAPPSGSQPPSCPATDPIASPTFHVATPQMAKQKYDFPVQVPATSLAEASRIKSGARRTKQVKNRLNQCIKEGSVPPYCQNCGAIETPTWRRAWYKVIEGNEETAKGVQNDVGALFWEPFDKDDDGTMTSFKQFKKTLAPQDTKFTQLCLCNPCGLYLYKMEKMRPENMWNKSAQKDKRKKNKTRPPLRPLPGLDHNNSLSTNTTTTTTATVAPPPLPLLKPSVPSPESSPTRSPHDDNKEEEMTIVTVTVTPGANDGDNIADVDGCGDDDIGDNGSTGIPDESGTHQATETTTPTMAVNTTMRNVPNEEDNHSPKHFQSPTHKRASSEQPPTSAEKRMRMDQGAAMKALKKAIQASPARNFNTSAAKKKQQQQQRQAQDDDLTPKPVCRNLFPTATANANANANAGATSTTTAALSPKPLGTTPGNVLKTSPVKHQQYQGVDSTMQLTGTEDKENEYPSLVGRIEDFFHNHSTAALDLALPVTPTKSQHCQSLPPQSEQSPVGFSPKNSLTPFKKNEVSSVWNSTPPFGSGSESVIETELDSNPLLETDLQSTSCLDDVFVTNIDSFSPQVSSLPPSGAPAADCSQFPDWEEWIASLGTAGGDGSHSGDGAGGQAGEHNPFDADFSFLQAAGDEALKSLLLNDITAGDDHTPTTLFDDFLALPPPPHHMNNNVGDADVIDGFDKEFQGLEETDLNVILDGARAAAAATTATVPSTTANVDASKTTMATTAPITAEANPIKGTAIGAEGVSVAPAQAQ
ncbi:hypothetical protein KEM54_005869 [Ascosphaera aggregata]|nr:hypothetical protein KEM54_005869 [Ascosphaera aggregata]